MIGRIAGTILHRGADHVLIDVHGVGYVVRVSERMAAGLPRVGEPVALYTDLQVREDLLQLYGFPSLLEREWHRLLTTVQGVGAKASLSVLGTLGAEGLGRAIALEDWGAVRKAPGIGPKLAQRIVLELKDKAPEIMAMGDVLTVDMGAVVAPEPQKPGGKPATGTAAATPGGSAAASAEALSALQNLGYGSSEAASAVAGAAAQSPDAATAALIRAALKALAPKG